MATTPNKLSEHPRVTVERYLALVDEHDIAQQAVMRAEVTLKRVAKRLDSTREDLFKCVGANVRRRVFQFAKCAVLVWWMPESASMVEVLELE